MTTPWIAGCAKPCVACDAATPATRRRIPNGAIRNQMYRAFPEKLYRQRTKVETIFSVVTRKLSSRAPGRSLAIQIRQALLLGLAYNLYRLRHPNPHEDVNRAINTYEKQGEGRGGPQTANSLLSHKAMLYTLSFHLAPQQLIQDTP